MKLLNDNKIKFILVLFLILIKELYPKNFLLSNIYFVIGMILLMASIISVLLNAHLFDGWRLKVTRKEDDFVQKITHEQDRFLDKEHLKQIASQKNKPLVFKPMTKILFWYALLFILVSVLVTFI